VHPIFKRNFARNFAQVASWHSLPPKSPKFRDFFFSGKGPNFKKQIAKYPHRDTSLGPLVCGAKKLPTTHNDATARAFCDAQRAAPRATGWAPRSSICDTGLSRCQRWLMWPFTTCALHSPCLVRASFVNKQNSTNESFLLVFIQKFTRTYVTFFFGGSK
jgi:hypothetical protein